MAPEHRRLSRYGTMDLAEITALPVESAAADVAHLYLWVPNALLPEGIQVMKAWGFEYKTNIVCTRCTLGELVTPASFGERNNAILDCGFPALRVSAALETLALSASSRPPPSPPTPQSSWRPPLLHIACLRR